MTAAREPPLARADVGDVGEPRPVGAVRAEVAPHQVRCGVRPRRGRLLPALRPPGAAARGAGRAPLAHDARHAPARGAHAVPPGLGVPLVARAGAAGSPRAVALPGRLERRAHLGDRPGPLVGLDERGLSPLRPRACSCPPAEGALASKGVSLSLFGRSLSRLSPRRSSAIRKGLSPAGARAASALLTQSDRPPGSMPGSRAASAWVPPRPLRSLTACCLDPAECLGDGCPVPCPPSPLTASCPNGTRRVDGNGGDSA